jgi:NAD(P)-dependent dehydrogenase (short-subunit alcohol dehydrogenase family)
MVIITGASQGVGKFLFSKFIEDGHKVIGTYNSTSIDKVVENFYQVNIADSSSVEKWTALIKSELKDIVLINCAGISYNSYAHKAVLNLWCNVINVNLIGTFNVIRHVLPLMREQKYGRIINFSSVVTSLPTPGVSAYAASKAGLLGLTKSLAIENASMGITINAINLGYANIGMGINEVPLIYQEKIKTQIPAGRFCEPEEVYNTVKYLIQTEYVNGAVIDVNGALI